MRFKNGLLIVLLLLIATAAGTQTAGSKAMAATTDASAIEGVWRAEADGLPFITVTITNETGSLSGAVLFYLHRRDAGKPMTSTPGIPEPLFNLSYDGETLTFQVSHRRAHPPGTLSDRPVTFRLKLTGKNQAVLVRGGLTNESEPTPGLALVRTEY